MEYFLAAAREQNITAAVESLHISQPALSTQLKALEAELGKQLLIRGVKGSRKVILTEEGMILRKRAEEMVSLMRRTEEISRSGETIVGDVYIGVAETEAIRLFAQAAKKLREAHPDIHCHISRGNEEHVLEYLDKGLIDFGLLFSQIDVQKHEAIPVPVKDRWGILMRRDSPLAGKKHICPEDLWDRFPSKGRQQLSGRMAEKGNFQTEYCGHLQPRV